MEKLEGRVMVDDYLCSFDHVYLYHGRLSESSWMFGKCGA
jgi:hypothetical protein